MRTSHLVFWQKHPALLFALSLLIGTHSILFEELVSCWILPFFWILYLLFFRFWAPITFLFASSLYALFFISTPSQSDIAYFSIHSLSPHISPFQRGLVYKGSLYSSNEKVPCTVYYLGADHPPANRDYILKGELQKRGPYDYLFKAKEWTKVSNTWSFAELRYQTKSRLKALLEQKLPSPRTALFLSALLTGDVEERSLRFEFGKLGLQHILAISGFHFAILIAFCSFFLDLFLHHRHKWLLLFFIVNGYYFFVGALPAVQRSWLTALFYLLGKWMGRQSSGLNLLGVAMLIELLLDPLASSHLGFRLSFLSCAGILLLAPLFSPSKEPTKSKHIQLLSLFFKQGIQITLAVNLAILPLLLTYFHQFPLLSLLYNLFFPFLVSVNLFLLLITLLTHLLLPFLSGPLFFLLDLFTKELLNLSANPPAALGYSIYASNFPSWIIPPYLFLLFCLSIYLDQKKISMTTHNTQ
jgi:competence protein ComEC